MSGFGGGSEPPAAQENWKDSIKWDDEDGPDQGSRLSAAGGGGGGKFSISIKAQPVPAASGAVQLSGPSASGGRRPTSAPSGPDLIRTDSNFSGGGQMFPTTDLFGAPAPAPVPIPAPVSDPFGASPFGSDFGATAAPPAAPKTVAAAASFGFNSLLDSPAAAGGPSSDLLSLGTPTDLMSSAAMAFSAQGQTDLDLLGGIDMSKVDISAPLPNAGASMFDSTSAAAVEEPKKGDQWGLINESNVVNLDNLNLSKATPAPPPAAKSNATMASLKAANAPLAAASFAQPLAPTLMTAGMPTMGGGMGDMPGGMGGMGALP